MIKIDLYQPGPAGIDSTIDFPSEWNDLSLDQLHLVAKFVLSDIKDPNDAKAALFLSLLDSACGTKIKNIDKRLDAQDAFLNGLPAINFLIEENNLTKQPYPTLKIPAVKNMPALTVHGPEDNFDRLTCGEFEDAEIFFLQFNQEPNAELLANIAAILYRPAGEKYLVRNGSTQEWIFYDSDKLVPQFKKLQTWVLYSIYLWYQGCREQLPKIFPEAFAGGDDKGEPDFVVFTKCIHAGAGVKNGSRNDIRMTPLKEFFMELNEQKIENDRQIAEMQKHG